MKEETKVKVIYIFERRYGYSFDYEMFGMKSFEEKNCEVEVWSVVRWNLGNIPEPRDIDLSGRTHFIDNEQQFNYELNRIKEDDCIFLIYPYHAYGYISYTIRKKIKKAGFDFCNITISPYIDIERCRNKLTYNKIIILYNEFKKFLYLLVKFMRNTISALFLGKRDSIKFNIAREWKNIYTGILGPFLYKSKYNFITVELCYATFPNQFECLSKRNFLVSAWVYNDYLELPKSDAKCDQEYVVFIDQFLTGHSTCIINGKEFPIQNKELYFDRMNSLFDNIEKEYNCCVIVAAHPKAEYNGNEFKSRKIIYNETAKLVKDAKLVIIQYSTCFDWVTLFNKDFLNIYASEFFENDPELKSIYELIQHCFKCEQLNIENETDVSHWQNFITKYNQQTYNSYINNYVISENGISDMGFWEFVAQKIIEK